MRRLVASQFPVWADLPVVPVAHSGWDNRTFHLGDQMSVRLPSAAPYAAQVEKEQTWLPRLAPELPLPIPEPLAMGRPTAEYPWHWSVYRWLPGESADPEGSADPVALARDLAGFLRTLERIDPNGGPPPGRHNFQRGGALSVYDRETREAVAALAGRIDSAAVLDIWERGLTSRWQRAPVWVHGDCAAGNLLLVDGRLAAVIDFGCMAVGDPACDLTIAWTLFPAPGRAAFREALALDDATWERGAAWALWKALILLRSQGPGQHPDTVRAGAVLAEILNDGQAGRLS